MHIYNKFVGDKYDKQTITFSNDVIFMNHGFVEVCEAGYPINDFYSVVFNKHNINNKLQAYLYYKLINSTKINTGTYLDLGCGRGGGINFVFDNFNFNKVYGLDISKVSIDFCKTWIPEAEFIEGSATEINLPDKSVDLITSVEAAHEFMPYTEFIEECYRILKPGGKYAQVGYLYDYSSILKYSIKGFILEEFTDITYNTALACAISKWNYFYKSKVFNNIVFTHFNNDEAFYLNKENKYHLTVLTKK